MCGIAGMCRFDGAPIDDGALNLMGSALAHRGPDDAGVFIDGGVPSVGLASRRLAVIDLAGGHQPMSVDDGALTIVYNGEIFNAGELRRELERRGRRFANRSDTEVILHGYAEWGVGVLDRLNGMWSFALWDRNRRRLFLARDRLGVKPLVYAQLDRGIAFASEIKALTAARVIDRELDLTALPHYLSSFTVPEPYTLMRGARRLLAGHALLVDTDGIRDFQYWDCALAEEEDRGAEWYREEVRELLADSVRRRLVSDVPLGVLLSGGIDSRLLATLASTEQSTLNTFTIGFGSGGADEREAARAVATALRARHFDRVVDGGEAVRAFPRLLAAYDEPGQSLIQTHFASELARSEVTVALSGLGGDELFSGYPTHVVVNMLARLDRVPRPLRAALLSGTALIPGHRSQTLRTLAAMPSDARVARHLIHQTTAALRDELLSPEVRATIDLDGPIRHLQEHYDRTPAQHPLNRLLYVYLKTYLPNELLRTSDAMSMLHGLEIRTPFLDYRLVERALQIPAHHKMRMRAGKLILRAVAAETLPSPIQSGKQGFSPPVRWWLDRYLTGSVRESLSTATVRHRGIFDPAVVQRVLGQCLAGDDRLIPPVMMLYSFETWAREWLDSPARQPATNGSRPVEITTHAPDVSVVIVNWNTKERLRACLASIEQHFTGAAHEVIVVDNASDDGSAAMVASRFPSARLICNDTNVGFGRANNQAMRIARGRWILLLNSDTVLFDDSVAHLLADLDENPGDLGIAHCRLLSPDGQLEPSVYRFPDLRLAIIEGLGLYKLASSRRAGNTLLSGYWDYADEREVDWVAGSFMLLPRKVFESTGGFDERIFMYGEDLEWCYRIRDQGWQVRFFPRAAIIHFGHTSSDRMWGGRPIALCLEMARDLYAGRHGRPRAAAFVAAQLVGVALRSAYYRLRIRLPGAHPPEFETRLRDANTARRALRKMALGRR